MYIHRAIEKRLKVAVSQFPVCLLTGPRQAGKSTLLQHNFKSHQYITLDDLLMRELAIKDPELFLSSYPAPLIIDEIQYAPMLLSYIKMRVDANRREYGQYILTGSQTFQLMKGVSETLAGRIAIFQLYPLSWQEIAHLSDHKKSALDDQEAFNQMITGFYPEFFAVPTMDKNLWLSSYLTTYIERDLRNLKAITDLSRFQTFLQLLAGRAGQLLNMNEIGKEAGISQPTVKDWLSLLEATYIIYILRPYHDNLSKRMVKSPKVFFVDTGLLCYLLGIDTKDRLLKSGEKGHIFENMVVMEFVKRMATLSQRTECFFYRTSSGVEIDLIVQQGHQIRAYEMKFSKTISLEAAKPLQQFQKDVTVESAQLLSLNEKTVPLGEGVVATHWSQANFPE